MSSIGNQSPGSGERAVLHQVAAAAAPPLRGRPRRRRARLPRGHPGRRRRRPDPHPALALLPHAEAAPAPAASGRRAGLRAAAAEGPVAPLGDGVQEGGVAVGLAADVGLVLVDGQGGEVGVRARVGQGEGSALSREVSYGVPATDCRNLIMFIQTEQ